MQNLLAREVMKGQDMTWNYRVVRFKNADVDEYYEIKEVFYDAQGNLTGYSEASVFSDTYDGLFECMELMRAATAKPVIDEEDFFAKKGTQ